ncbi:dTDP-6-deoxy-L-hexose 3-O-methyltransferase [Marinifilum sp. JC120]|nr:dTDP-6-deoxy-L-hexose 3-O-methyltransferase [Marinifilum sp. JC120]
MEDIFGYELANKWDYENGFYLTSDKTRIPKLLAHYELYKMISSLPGHVVECGVFKGASLIRFATFRDALESSYSRKIIGFDAFGKFPEQEHVEDKKFIEIFESDAGDGISKDELAQVFKHKNIENYELIEGDICSTIPEYLVDHPELKVALLHIDVDVYKPTKVILEHLYDRIVPGGLIVFDDYSIVAGETQAIDEFFADSGAQFEKLKISHRPTFYRKK